MNIFYLSHDQEQCAKWHVDRHCVKMVTEYAQLLSSAHRILDGESRVGLSDSGRKKTLWVLPDERNRIVYAATHVNHPSAVWARASDSNYSWLAIMLRSLCREYTHRY